MTTSEITRWLRAWRTRHPEGRFLDALPALLAAHPEAGAYSAGTTAACFALAEPVADEDRYPAPTAHVAARVVLVECPDNPDSPSGNGVLTPRGGFEARAYERFPDTLKEIEGPLVNGIVAFTWEGDPATDEELTTRSAQIVRDELSRKGEWDGYTGWYGPHDYIDNPEKPGTCAYKPRDVHNQLKPCGEIAWEHELNPTTPHPDDVAKEQS